MKNIFYSFLLFSLISFGQTYNEAGVKFMIKDTIMVFENMDRKYKTIKIVEQESHLIGETQLMSNYTIEGDVVEEHKFYSKNGTIKIEIIVDTLKRTFWIKRK